MGPAANPELCPYLRKKHKKASFRDENSSQTSSRSASDRCTAAVSGATCGSVSRICTTAHARASLAGQCLDCIDANRRMTWGISSIALRDIHISSYFLYIIRTAPNERNTTFRDFFSTESRRYFLQSKSQRFPHLRKFPALDTDFD